MATEAITFTRAGGRLLADGWPHEVSFGVRFLELAPQVMATDQFINVKVDNGEALYEITSRDPDFYRVNAVLRQSYIEMEPRRAPL